jgi:hypothetical protein
MSERLAIEMERSESQVMANSVASSKLLRFTP